MHVRKVLKTCPRSTKVLYRIIPDYPVTIPCPQRLASQRTCCFRHYLLRSCCYLHQWPNDGPDFVGRTSLVIDIYGMSSENSSSTLLKMSFEKGSDGQAHYQRLASKFQTSREILRALCIDDWQRRNPLPTSKLCRTSLESLQKEHTMVHELAQHPANIWLLQVNGSQTWWTTPQRSHCNGDHHWKC
jgi:hypothetical protein